MAKIKQATAAAARQAGKLEMPGTSIAEMTLSGFSGYYYHFYGCREPRRGEARRSMDRLITRPIHEFRFENDAINEDRSIELARQGDLASTLPIQG